MEDYIVTPAGLHANFHILAAEQSKDSASATGFSETTYIQKHTEQFAVCFYENMKISGAKLPLRF